MTSAFFTDVPTDVASDVPLRRRRTIITITAISILVHSYFAVFRLLWSWPSAPVRMIVEAAVVDVIVWATAMTFLLPVIRRLTLGERRRRDLCAVAGGVLFVPVLTSVAELVTLGSLDVTRWTWPIVTSVLTPFSATTSALAIVVASLLASREESYERQRRGFELGSLLMRSQAAQLRARVRPPFIAAVLDDIAARIDVDGKAADRMLITFAEFLRSVLDVEREATISVEAELELIDRFVTLAPGAASALQLHADDDALDAHVPPLLIYPVVAMFVEEGAPRISIDVREGTRLQVMVSSPALTADQAAARLDVLQRRLEHLYPGCETMRIESTPALTTVTLTIPEPSDHDDQSSHR